VQLHHHALEVEDDVDDVLLHPLDRGVLVQHAGNLDLGGGVAGHRREQDAAQRVSERVAVAALEGLHDHLRMRGRQVLDIDDAGLQEIRGIALHSGVPLPDALGKRAPASLRFDYFE
jgi:hypothetical protein